MSVQNKTARVTPVQTTPYIKGTEAPNYYLVTDETYVAIVGFRPLSVAVPAIGSTPTKGTETRVRIVPKDQSAAGLQRAQCLEHVLGFEYRKHPGETQVHYSKVTTDAAALIQKVNKLLSLF